MTIISGLDTGWRRMFMLLLTFLIVACWVADTTGLGDFAWLPPGDLAVLLAPTRHLDQRRFQLPITSPLPPACACNYAWQRSPSSTSSITWGQSGLHNLGHITIISAHGTGWSGMFTPLLTFQIGACWVADTARLGDCAWLPPGDLTVLLASTRHLDQRRFQLPISSPLTPACACNYAWQRIPSSTSSMTWGQSGLHNLRHITIMSAHDTGWSGMFMPLLTFQIGACWVADTARLGDCAWLQPGDLTMLLASNAIWINDGSSYPSPAR